MNVYSYFRLIRPVNAVMIGFAVLVGEAVASSTLKLNLTTLFGFLTGFCITAYSMVINDIFDREVDRANNRSDRPIASGLIAVRNAWMYSMILLLMGLTFSLLTGLATFIIALAFAGVSILYNYRLKETGLLGNVSVALSMTIPFIYGGILVGRGLNMLLDMMALTAFLAGVGREVIKGITDVEGDALRNVRSIARVKGVKIASVVGGALFLLAVVTSQIPTLMGRVNSPYLIVIGITDMIFIFLAAYIISDSGKAKRVKNLALLGMLLGLIGFILQGVLP
ncbi:MAG: UbiA family prenyltransferase [Conexivisphaerales archaeon]